MFGESQHLLPIRHNKSLHVPRHRELAGRSSRASLKKTSIGFNGSNMWRTQTRTKADITILRASTGSIPRFNMRSIDLFLASVGYSLAAQSENFSSLAKEALGDLSGSAWG